MSRAADRPDLETRIEGAVVTMLQLAFNGVAVHSWSDPGDDGEVYLSVRAESGGEELPGTGIHEISLTIEGKNLSAPQRDKLNQLFADYHVARETILRKSAGKFFIPAGEAVEVMPRTRRRDNQNDSFEAHNLMLSAQPAELPVAA